MAAEYNQDQSGLRSELDEPRRTHDGLNSGGFGGENQGGVEGYGGQDQTNTGADFAPQDQTNTGSDFAPQDQQPRDFGREDQLPGSGNTGGYGGVSEDVPPQHKLHSDEERLLAPAPGTYDDQPRDAENFGSADQPAGEQGLPQPTVGGQGYSDAPRSTEDYQEYRDAQPTQNFDDAPGAGTGVTDEGVSQGGYQDPSAAFPGAPVERKLEQPGYGYDDQKTSGMNADLPDENVTPNDTFLGSGGEPVDNTAPTGTPHEPINTTMGTGAPKKEGLITKIKEKLPGHHKSADTAAQDTTMDDTTAASPKKGLITKLKEKLPGHHNTE